MFMLKLFKGNVPYLFQIDLRDDPKTIAKLNDMKEKPIATEQGQKLAKEVWKKQQSNTTGVYFHF